MIIRPGRDGLTITGNTSVQGILSATTSMSAPVGNFSNLKGSKNSSNNWAYELANNGIYSNGNLVWHAGNDGANSGLDADLLDGQQGSYYLSWTNATQKPSPTITINLTGDVTGSGNVVLNELTNATINIASSVVGGGGGNSSVPYFFYIKDYGATGDGVANDTAALVAADSAGNGTIIIANGVFRITSNTTVTSPVHVIEGGVILADNCRVEFLSSLVGPSQEIFQYSGTGDVVLSNTSQQCPSYPEWYGNNTVLYNNAQVAINRSLNAARVTKLTRFFYTNNTVSFPNTSQYQTLFGTSDSACGIISSSTNTDILAVVGRPGVGYIQYPVVKDFAISRSVTPTVPADEADDVTDAPVGVRTNMVIRGDFANITAYNSTLNWYITNTGACKYYNIKGFNIGGALARYYGVYVDGESTGDILGFATPNPSLRLDHAQFADMVNSTLSTGIKIKGRFSDIFMIGPETGGTHYGIDIEGSTGYVENIDVHITQPILDAFKTSAIRIRNVNQHGAITIMGGYTSAASAASNAGIYIANSRGVSISGGTQFINYLAANNYTAITAEQSYNITLNGMLFKDCSRAINFNETYESTIKDASIFKSLQVANSAAAITISNGSNIKVEATISGPSANAYGVGIDIVNTTNSMVDLTGINQSSVTNRVKIDGVAVEDNGLVGSILVHGQYTGSLIAPQNKFRVGTNQIIAVSNNIGINVSTASSTLTINGNPPTAGALGVVGGAANVSLALSDNINNSLYVKHTAGPVLLGTDPGGAIALCANGYDKVLQTSSNGYVRFIPLTSDPTGTEAGNFYYNSTSHNFKFNNGSSWQTIWGSTNDGSGSGLDADLLDGQEGSYYTNATNISSGTLSNSRLNSANTTQAGIVQLVDSVSNTSIVLAATANSVKLAYDTAIAAGSAATAYSNAIAFAANATNITSGTLDNARLINANTTSLGIVQLVDSVSNTSIVLAATANSIKTTYDQITTKANEAYSNATTFSSNATNLTSGTVSNSRLTTSNTSQAGIVQLVDSVSNTSIVLAATANSVKAAYDYATTISGTAYSNAIAFAANATNITSGTVNNARLNAANTSQAGIVQLVDSVSNTSTVIAPTANAIKTTYDYAGSIAGTAYANAIAVAANATNLTSGTIPSARFNSAMVVPGTLSLNNQAIQTVIIPTAFGIHGTTTDAYMGMSRWSASAAGPGILIGKSRGASVGTRGIVSNADVLGEIYFTGDDGAKFIPGGQIRVVVNGTPGVNDMPGMMIFSVSPDGSNTVSDVMRIAANTNVGINSTSPASSLSVGGNPPTSGRIAAVAASANVSLALSDNINNSLYVKHTAGPVLIGTDPGGRLGLCGNAFNVMLSTVATGQMRYTGLASEPAGLAGDLYYNTTTKTFKFNNGTIWQHVAQPQITETISSDAAFTLTPFTSGSTIIHTGTLTADRAITLSTTNASNGHRFRVTRTGGGAFNLSVGGLKNLATNTWCDVQYNGSAWVLTAYGAL